MTCLTEQCVNESNYKYDKYIKKGVYVYNQYIDEYDHDYYIIHVMFIGNKNSDIIIPQVCFKVLYNHGNITFMGLDNDYYDYVYDLYLDYYKIKKFLEIEFIKIVNYSIQDDISMNYHKKKRIELNSLIKFLDKFES